MMFDWSLNWMVTLILGFSLKSILNSYFKLEI